MKPSKLFLIAVIIGAMAASSAMARPTAVRTQSPSRNVSVARASSTHWARNNNNWRHYRHHRHSRVYFAFGYPFGYGYPYYGYYPYGYGYYGAPREAIYQAYRGPLDRPRTCSGAWPVPAIIMARSMGSSGMEPAMPFVRMNARTAFELMARSTSGCSRPWASPNPRE